MPTFVIGFSSQEANIANAAMLERLARETGGNVESARAARAASWQRPADLRGIPAIGRNCPGRIAGTRPDQICDR